MDPSAKVIRVLARAQVDSIEAEIERCLGIVGRELDVDIISFCQEAEGHLSTTLQWRAVGYMDPPLELELTGTGWFRDQLEEDLVLDEVSDLPPQAARERERLAERGTRSLAASALGGGRRAYVVAETQRTARRWRERDLDLLTALAGATAAALDRREHQLALMQTADEAARASEQKSLFIASLSHELKSPLSSIRMAASMLNKGYYGDLTDEQQGAVRELAVASDLLFAVVEDLLDLARIEAGRMTLEVQRVDVTRTIERVLVSTAARARERKIEVASKVPDELIVHADDRKLVQIVQNLVVNAIKYNVVGGRLTVRLGATAEEYRIEVEDTGIGISERDQERIFGTFARLDNAPKARKRDLPEGAGLGLSLVRALTQLHGGRLELESEPGRGSNFAVILPRHPRERAVGREPYLGGMLATEATEGG